MKEHHEEESHFKMRMDNSIEEPEIPADVDDLRMEKLNTRVTIISVMIPVLIVIVLVIAYLDIQKRVTHTEDTGSMSIQKISEDLESRFSSISLRQAQLEDEIKRLFDSSNQSAARLEVKLTQLDAALKDARAKLADKREVSDAVAGLDKKLGNVAAALDETRIQLAEIPAQLAAGIEQIRVSATESKTKITGVEEKLTRLNNEKIDKPALDLALRLENLKLEQLLKAQIGTLEDKLRSLEKQVGQAAAKPATIPAAPVRPKPAAPGIAPPTAPPDQSIQEQIIVQ
jgi:hypothetical protein